ncbi:MAG: uracil-DNA glycosylase, partial [Paracoccaceae bacterium]
MDGALNWHVARAMLEWQREMGVDEAIVDAPIDRYAQAAKAEAAAKLAKEQAAQGRSVQNQHAASPMPAPQVDPVDV